MAITATRVRWARQVWRRSGPLIMPAPGRPTRTRRRVRRRGSRSSSRKASSSRAGSIEQVRHRERGDDREQGLRVALEVAGERRPVDGDRRHAGDAREVGRIALEPQLDPPLAAREERRHVLVRDQTARPHHGDAVADPLDLGQHVRGEQHRPPGPPDVVDDRVERPLHERVEAFGRFVEDRQLRIVLQRLDDPELLAHASRVVADRPAERSRIELEAVAQRRAPDGRPAGEVGEVVEVALTRQAVVERDAAGQVAGVGADGHGLGDDVPPEHSRRPGRRVQEPEQEPDEGALAGAVGPEEPEHLARADVERDVVERRDRRAAMPQPAAVVLGQPAGRDRVRRR